MLSERPRPAKRVDGNEGRTPEGVTGQGDRTLIRTETVGSVVKERTPVYGTSDAGSNGPGYHLFRPLNGLPDLIRFSLFFVITVKVTRGRDNQGHKKHPVRFSERRAIGDGELSHTAS